jgi:hypothetical protein
MTATANIFQSNVQLVNSDFRMSQQAFKNTNVKLGCVDRSIVFRIREIVPFYPVLLQPHLR